jgi:penicillin-insensitive murein DD-endopeptidase
MIDCRFGLSALQPCSRNSPESAQMAGQTTSMSIRALSIALIAAAVALAGGTSPAVAKKRTPAPKLSLSDPAAPTPGDGKVPDAAAAQSAAAPSSEARPGPQAVTEEIAEPAKKLFAEKELPSIGKAAAIGYYPRGCLRGGVELPSTGATWQVMRISRNRNWGHPALIKFLERFAPLAAKATGWHGVLVGDMAQPRGGPLPYGHSSHQIGLDVDVWFMPMPDRVLSKDERDNMPFLNLVAGDRKHINSSVWTPAHAAFIRTAAEQPEVERVLVNAAIKKELCTMQGDKHPAWMSKVRPWYGHDDHIHVRLRCPADSPTCRKQDPPRDGPGCSDKDFKPWFADKVLHPEPSTPSAEPAKPPHQITLADLPKVCKDVLEAPARKLVQSKAN